MHQIQLTTISSKRPNSKVLNLSNINQINLWIQSSIEKVSKQASTQLIIQPIEKLVTDQLIHQSVRPSVAINKSVSQIDSESVSRQVFQIQSVRQPVVWWVRKSVDYSIGQLQSACPPVSFDSFDQPNSSVAHYRSPTEKPRCTFMYCTDPKTISDYSFQVFWIVWRILHRHTCRLAVLCIHSNCSLLLPLIA